jgi:hypothetical protein
MMGTFRHVVTVTLRPAGRCDGGHRGVYLWMGILGSREGEIRWVPE